MSLADVGLDLTALLKLYFVLEGVTLPNNVLPRIFV
jgi:hypothetical protein